MRTRSAEEMMQLILGFANGEERIRAVLLNGSRANPNAASDPFQDFDVMCLVTDVEPFKDPDVVVPAFGETLVVEQPLIGPWPPDDADGSFHNYNIQLLDGNRVDISFHHVDTLEERLSDSLTRVLIDKDSRIPPLPPPSTQSYYITKPTKELYEGCCTGFLFALGSHIPKRIWRAQLPALKSMVECWLRTSTVMMLEWEIGVHSGWEQSSGSNGKYLARLLPPGRWTEYERTFVGSDYDEIWDSLFRFLAVFSGSAKVVADKFGFRFPAETAAKTEAFLKQVRSLPPDATTIYQHPADST